MLLDYTVLYRMDISFRPEWNGSFHSGRNKMVHSIPAGIKWPIPFWPEWTSSHQPEWNGSFHSGRGPFRPEWNGPFHFDRNGMDHFIPAGMEWTNSFRPEWNRPFCSTHFHGPILARMKWTISFWPERNVHSVEENKKYSAGRPW